MTATPSEVALARVLGYLRLSGIPLTREVTRSALELVREALAQDEEPEDLLAWVMDQLPRFLALPDPPEPPPYPPIRRGSLHYEP
jgi:hypothetical protein